jgi:hypothetical protein
MNIRYPEEFVQEMRLLIKNKKLPNYSEKKSQKLDKNNFFQESFTIYHDFGNSNFKKILINLNSRKIIKDFGDWKLVMNYNTSDFFRDANYSISLVNKEFKEVAIISFYPVMTKTLRIVQIQGQKNFIPSTGDLLSDWKKILIDEIKLFGKENNFDYLAILRAEENYLIKFPRNVGPDFNLEEHKKSMIYIYNVLPIKKWGFKYKKGDFYSYFKL